MRSTKLVPRIFLALVALVAGIVALVLRQRLTTKQVTSGKTTQPDYRQTPVWRIYDWAAETLDHAIGWDKVPLPLGLLMLIGLRNILRQQNLHDTTHEPAINQPAIEPMQARYLTARTSDGTHNDLKNPAMGMAGSRFGRNVPIEYTFPEPEPAILTPHPPTVSLELLTREKFQPATTVNMLAAAWVQFMVRDWFSHGTSPKENPWQIQLRDDDPWPEHPMKILRVPSDPTRPANSRNLPPTYINSETHWWDASQMYGSSKEQEALRRSGREGKLIIGSNGLLPLPSDPNLNPALVPGWWLGMEMMITLFTLEHNAICDRLRAEYPNWSDDDIFERATLRPTYPGDIILYHYTRFVQHFCRSDGNFVDLAETDIMRTRELGVPRYNQFRKLLPLPLANSFEELTDDPPLAEKIRRVYNND